jgi:hypothetical protein
MCGTQSAMCAICECDQRAAISAKQRAENPDARLWVLQRMVEQVVQADNCQLQAVVLNSAQELVRREFSIDGPATLLRRATSAALFTR